MGRLGKGNWREHGRKVEKGLSVLFSFEQESSSPKLPSLLSEETTHQSGGAQWLLGPWRTVTGDSILAAENGG